MTKRHVPTIQGLEDVALLLDLLSNKEAYQAKVLELSALVTEAHKAVEAEDIAGDVSSARIQAQTDRTMAREVLSKARQEAKSLMDKAELDMKSKWEALGETHRQLDKARADHLANVKDWEDDMAKSVTRLNEREALQNTREANLHALTMDVAARDVALKTREAKLKQAAALVG